MPDKNRFFYGYNIVIISFLALMLTLGMRNMFGIFFKPIIEELEWTRAATSGAFSLCVIMAGLVGIIIGGLNDRFGPRLMVTICGLLSGLGYLLMSQIQDVWHLYLFFGVIFGAGSNTFVPLLSTVARWFVQRRSMMTGIVFAGSGVGMLILPLVINQLMAVYSWRVCCLIMGTIILVIMASSAQFLKRDPSQVGRVAYGADNITAEGLKSVARDLSLKEATRTRQLWIFLTMLICYGFCFYSVQVHIAPYATDIGISASGAAAILATIGGAIIIGQLGLGGAGDRLGYKRTFLTGIILVTLAVLMLVLVREPWAFFLLAIFLGVGFGGCSTMLSPISAWLFGLASHGLILGVFTFGFTIGAAIGPLLSGYIFDVTGNYQSAFLVCIAVAAVAVILTIFLKRPNTESSLKTLK
jgi:MFS family permease